MVVRRAGWAHSAGARVAAARDEGEGGVVDIVVEGLGDGGWDEDVLCAPDDEGGDGDLVEMEVEEVAARGHGGDAAVDDPGVGA